MLLSTASSSNLTWAWVSKVLFEMDKTLDLTSLESLYWSPLISSNWLACLDTLAITNSSSLIFLFKCSCSILWSFEHLMIEFCLIWTGSICSVITCLILFSNWNHCTSEAFPAMIWNISWLKSTYSGFPCSSLFCLYSWTLFKMPMSSSARSISFIISRSFSRCWS